MLVNDTSVIIELNCLENYREITIDSNLKNDSRVTLIICMIGNLCINVIKRIS